MTPDFCGNCTFYADRECRRFPPRPQYWWNPHTYRYEMACLYPPVTADTPRGGEFESKGELMKMTTALPL